MAPKSNPYDLSKEDVARKRGAERPKYFGTGGGGDESWSPLGNLVGEGREWLLGKETDLGYDVGDLDRRIAARQAAAAQDYGLRGYEGARDLEMDLISRVYGGRRSLAEEVAKQKMAQQMQGALAARAANPRNLSAINYQTGRALGSEIGRGGEQRVEEQIAAQQALRDYMAQEMAGRMEMERRNALERQKRNELAYQKAAWDAYKSARPGLGNPLMQAGSQALASYMSSGGGGGGGGSDYYEALDKRAGEGGGQTSQPVSGWGYGEQQDTEFGWG